MKFTKILDGNNIQGFSVSKPSATFKKLFPRRYTFSLDVMGNHIIINEDEIPKNFTVYAPIGYVFTYEKKLPKWLISEKVDFQDIGGSFPACLDSYFSGTDDNIDLIISCCPKDNIVPAQFVNEIIVQCNSDQLMAKNKLKENILKIVNGYLNEGEFTVENWFRSVIFNYPINNNGLPVHFQKVISENTIKRCSVNTNDLFIEYDFRAKSYEKEEEFIRSIEDNFENLNEEIIIYNDYNDILPRMKKELDKKKLKYKTLTNDSIKVKAKFIRDLNLTYQFTDFI